MAANSIERLKDRFYSVEQLTLHTLILTHMLVHWLKDELVKPDDQRWLKTVKIVVDASHPKHEPTIRLRLTLTKGFVQHATSEFFEAYDRLTEYAMAMAMPDALELSLFEKLTIVPARINQELSALSLIIPIPLSMDGQEDLTEELILFINAMMIDMIPRFMREKGESLDSGFPFNSSMVVSMADDSEFNKLNTVRHEYDNSLRHTVLNDCLTVMQSVAEEAENG